MTTGVDYIVELILVVDDEEVVRGLIKVILEIDGFAVLVAANGAEAIEGVRQHRPSAMILDLHMPGVDGLGVLAEVASILPVIVLTADPNPQLHDRALELGARLVMDKPFNVFQLLDKVRRVVRPSLYQEREA